ncbi:MAG: PPOX class F420-dependent oxidoreductase [Nocardiopsaceae bacterium]|nr:PPOX class F420-dependent oxidoreductase [Nocardiopsaceae bacterium]
MTIIPKEREDILNKPAFAHVATIGPNGGPQSSPVWFEWDGDFLKISQTTSRQKYRNLRRDDRLSLSVQDPEDPYRYVEVRGRVERFEDDTDNVFIDRLAQRYLGQDAYPSPDQSEQRVVLYVRPEHTTMQ